MKKLFCLTILFLLTFSSAQERKPVFREDFKEVPAHIPATSKDLTSDFLTLKRLGPGADKLKLSYHPEIPNDPHYLWNGECEGPVLIAFPFQKSLDLSARNWRCRLNTKNFATSTLHLAFRSKGKWFAQKKSVATAKGWNEQTLTVHAHPWFPLNPEIVTLGTQAVKPNFKTIDAIGFAAPINSNRSKDCIRLNWFELFQGETKAPQTSQLSKDSFIEPETPFLRSALVFKHQGQEHFVRRGVIVPLHYKNRWACFDPDTLHWTVVWEAPSGKQPITMDSMAAISFPDKKAKAKRVPRPVGKTLLTFPGSPSGSPPSDGRSSHLTNHDRTVGPFPPSRGRWLGLSLKKDQVIIHYTQNSKPHQEMVFSSADFLFERIQQSQDAQSSNYKNTFTRHHNNNRIEKVTVSDPQFSAPTPTFPKTYSATNAPPQESNPFTIRNLNFPELNRPIRATDIAFRANGDGFLSTLDGDIWRIQNADGKVSQWTRIATGIFEPMAIEVDSQDRLFTLGRDQITELIDTNNDGHIDKFRNASDAFLQTLHTRDYATSLAIGEDGSFYLAKGGIFNPNEKNIENELSEHRGTILHITPDGQTATILADGLRLPYVGLRRDGVLFASDQQGHYIPSTPLHLITPGKPSFGFKPTKRQGDKTIAAPLLWYPYQANRSAAAFCTTAPQAFPDLPHTFLQTSWNGRLFAVHTPASEQPFSWQLPLQLDFPSLNGAVHPQSGRLYLAGLGISGYLPTTPKFIGLASIEQTQAFPTPTALEINTNTITVTFNRPLTKTESITPGHPTLRLFNIKRTHKYGSGHYLWNDKPGEHHFAPKSFELSPDRQTFRATFDDLHRSDLCDLQLSISTATTTFPIHLYTQPAHLSPASADDLRKLAQAEKNKPDLQPGQAELGQPLFTQYACIGCHSLTGEQLTGPAMNGVAKRLNAEKLRESILNPTAEITAGFEPAMPSFEGVIPPQDFEHLLSYLQTLNSSK